MALWKKPEPVDGPGADVDGSDPDPRDAPLPVVLAETVARHLTGATVDGTTVTLGDTGVLISCDTGEPAALGGLLAVPLYLTVYGGPFGDEPSFTSISGYHDTPAGAVVEGGCVWTRTLLDLLAEAGALAQEVSPDQNMTTRAARIGGRLYRVHSSTIDRVISFDDGDSAKRIRDARRRVGGDRTLTTAVLNTDTLPVHASDTALLLSAFGMFITDVVTPEVKVHGGDWPPSWTAISEIGPEPPGAATLLRELAVAVPVEPARWERDALTATLELIGDHRTETHQAAGWRGWWRHEGKLRTPLTDTELRSTGLDPARLPADYHHFITEVGWGAGPGYGLVRPVPHGDGILLAHGGDGIWWLLTSDGVWVDAAGSDGTITRTHETFSAWYASWLDNAVAGGRPWLHWDHSACAGISVLSQILDQESAEGRNTRSLAGRLAPGSVTLRSGGGLIPEGEPIDPCHGCLTVYADFGLGDEVFAYTDSA
ncbi:MAG: hypothetical protein P8Z68_06205 [Kineosporiaceae bacterium]|jgi:hypothetical protein